MATTEIKLSGWQGIAALIGLGVLVLVRLATFGNGIEDESLVNALRKKLVIEHYEALTEHLPAKVRRGEKADLNEEITANLVFEEIRTSYPFLDFSSPRDVVVKVRYSIRGEFGPGDPVTEYYQYRHQLIGLETWEYRHNSGKVSYYLNFM